MLKWKIVSEYLKRKKKLKLANFVAFTNEICTVGREVLYSGCTHRG